MTYRLHLRFIGAEVYCSVVKRRVKLDRNHRYGDAFTCPGCGVRQPARQIQRPWKAPVTEQNA